MGNNFFDLPTRANNRNRTNVRDYINLKDGPVTVQFLTSPVETYTHWIATDGTRMPFTCLGENCPVCRRNAKIEDPDHDPDYIERTRKYASNVVDLTKVKKCPECGTINARNATKCQNDECNKILIEVEAEPMNMVRYLEGTWTLYEGNLKGLLTQLASTFDELDIRTIPLTIAQHRQNKTTTYTILPDMNADYAVDPDDYMDQLHDLSQTGITLEPDELTIVMNGGSFKDLMAAKREQREEKSGESQTMQEKVANIFD